MWATLCLSSNQPELLSDVLRLYRRGWRLLLASPDNVLRYDVERLCGSAQLWNGHANDHGSGTCTEFGSSCGTNATDNANSCTRTGSKSSSRTSAGHVIFRPEQMSELRAD